VLGGLSGSVTNVGHLVHSLERPVNPVVNLLGFAPLTLHLTTAITWMVGEGLVVLFSQSWVEWLV
jgi:hypothetical protein